MNSAEEVAFRKGEIAKAATIVKHKLDLDCDECGAYLNFDTLKTKCAICPVERKRQRTARRYSKLINSLEVKPCL